MSTRLIHYHIFKNAGTSVDEALHRSFGDAFMSFEGGHAHDVQGAQDVRRFIAAHPQVRAIATHLGRPPLPDDDTLPIVFLRHPLLRARSVYEFLSRHHPQHAGHQPSFAAFVEWCLHPTASGGQGIVIRDYQVVHLSEASFARPSILAAQATPAHLAQACGLLDSFGMVGIVELYEHSAALYQRLYGPRVPGLDFAVHWLNRSRGGQLRRMPDLLAEVQQALGPALHARLVDANRLDLQLHAHGLALLARAAREAGMPEKDAGVDAGAGTGHADARSIQDVAATGAERR